MSSSFTYDYCEKSAGRDYLVGEISCSIFGSDKSFDDLARPLPIYGPLRSIDSKTGLTTFTGYISSDLPFFEPDLVWKDATYDHTAPLWGNDTPLCISVFVDGETKHPIIEYPVLAKEERRRITLDFTDGSVRRPLMFKERVFSARRPPAYAGYDQEEMSSLTVTVSRCEILNVKAHSNTAHPSRAGSQWTGYSANLQYDLDKLSHLVQIGEHQSCSDRDKATFAARSHLFIRDKQPLAEFIFRYRSTAILQRRFNTSALHTLKNRAQIPPARPPLSSAAMLLGKLSLLPAKTKLRDMAAIATICKGASRAISALIRALVEQDWVVFSTLKEQAQAIESFLVFLPAPSRLSSFLLACDTKIDMINVYNAMLDLLGLLVKLRNSDIRPAYVARVKSYGFYALGGNKLIPATVQNLRDYRDNGALQKLIDDSFLEESTAAVTNSTASKKARLGDAAGLSQQRPRQAEPGPGPNTAAARALASTSGSTIVSSKRTSQNHGNPTANTAGTVQGVRNRDTSSEDVKPLRKRMVIDLTDDDDQEQGSRSTTKAVKKQVPAHGPSTSIRGVLAELLGKQLIDPEILAVFAKSGYDADTESDVFKALFSMCHDTAKNRFYALLDEKMPLIPFGILMKKLE